MPNIRVRFAPSPTGHLHAGNARIALMNYLFAKRHQGEFMLRMDDTDLQRSKPEFIDGIIADLAWLGINPDLYAAQSQRMHKYQIAREQLIDDGRLYPCFETSAELDLKRKILLGQNLPPLYDRSALNLTQNEIANYQAEGRKPHWRFKLDASLIEWDDLAKGKQSFVPEHFSDPVLIRGDGLPLFVFTTVVDDLEFAITHIIRGDDHISNTALQIQIFAALGAKALPEFAHLPLIANHEGKNFSKRDNDVSLEKIRESVIEPHTLIAYLIRIGTANAANGTETFQTLMADFDPSLYGKASPRFTLTDLDDLNSKILQHTQFADIATRLRKISPKAASEDFWQMVKQNIVHFSDVELWCNICFGEITPVIAPENEILATCAANLLTQEHIDNQSYKLWLNQITEITGKTGRALFMPLRLALTGRNHGPEIGALITQIGYRKARARLNNH